MKKKTAIIGGFLLLFLSGVSGLAYWTYSQAIAFQSHVQQFSDQNSLAAKGIEFAHIRIGVGDLDQDANFPHAKGKLRLNARNLCNDTLLDMGTLEYSISQWPWLSNTGEIRWYAPVTEKEPEPVPLMQMTVRVEGDKTTYSLQENAWLSTLALKPVLTIRADPEGYQVRASVQTLKLPAVTGDPSDFLARNFQLALNLPSAALVDSRLEIKADQIGFETENIQQLDLSLSGEVDDGERIRWIAEISTNALMFKSLLMDSTQGRHELTVGDASALQFLIKSAIQSCGGYATASSHEFNVRAALNKLVSAGLKLDSQTELQLLGEKVKWAIRTEFIPQNDPTTGFLDLGRSLQIHTQFAMPFGKMGVRQQDLFLGSGFFNQEDVKKPYIKTSKTNAVNALSAMKATPKGTLAHNKSLTFGDAMSNIEQALYLKDFGFASNTQKVPRVAFDGLRDVTVDSEGTVKMRIKAP